MGFWLDHLSAVLIASAVVMLLAATWVRSQGSSVEATSAYQARTRVEALREVLDGDMARLGADVDEADEAILGLSWTGATRSFEFRGRVDAPAAAAPDRIRYLATETACSSGTGTCWRFRRQVHDGAVYRDAGFDVEADTVEVRLLPEGDPAEATAAEVHLVLPSAGTSGAPAVSIGRYYRLVNQLIRTRS